MKRIVIIGNNGVGKSVFADKLGERLGRVVTHMDKLYHKPDWSSVSHEEWDRIHDKLVKGESWILDGTYPRTLDKRLERADTVIFLDYPKYLAFWGAVKRRRERGRKEGNLSWRLVKKMGMFPRGKVLSKLRKLKEKKVVILRSRKEAEAFIDGVGV